MSVAVKYPETSSAKPTNAPDTAVQLPVVESADLLCVAPEEGEFGEVFRLSDVLGVHPEVVQLTVARPTSSLQVTAEMIFGSQSVLVTEQTPIRNEPLSLTDNIVFQSVVLLLAAVYGMMLYHCLGEIRLLLQRITRDTNAAERFYDNSANNGFARFLHTMTAIGLFFLGVMTVKYADSLLAEQHLVQLSSEVVLGLGLLLPLVFLILFLVQWGMLSGIGALTLSRPFIAQLQQLRRTYFALAVVVVAPVLLLFALCPRGTGGLWFLLIVIELAVTSFLYFKETLNLFLSKKISILHWFLYLCGVEIFPISLAWLAFAR